MYNYNLYMTKYTTIRVSKETHELLLNQGTVRDSLDSVIQKLILKEKEGNIS
jgi:predicted DNA-binding transcriptional regulator